MEKLLPNKIFYDELADNYDEMISFDSAVEKKKNLLKKFVNLDTITAADIGCGSGVDSIALSMVGIKVTAFDRATAPPPIYKVNAKKMNVSVEFHNSAADQIPKEHNNKFDLVISLGNTFTNIPHEKFNDSIKRCCDILKPNGQLLIQVLNYTGILMDKKRIVSIKEGKEKYFIRFYDFISEQIIFNILTFSRNNNSDFKLTSTRIYPHLSEDYISGLNTFGFNSISLFGDLIFSEFIPTQSKDLIILAK